MSDEFENEPVRGLPGRLPPVDQSSPPVAGFQAPRCRRPCQSASEAVPKRSRLLLSPKPPTETCSQAMPSGARQTSRPLRGLPTTA